MARKRGRRERWWGPIGPDTGGTAPRPRASEPPARRRPAPAPSPPLSLSVSSSLRYGATSALLQIVLCVLALGLLPLGPGLLACCAVLWGAAARTRHRTAHRVDLTPLEEGAEADGAAASPAADTEASIRTEVTAFGHLLSRHPFRPDAEAATYGQLSDWTQALDAYERAARSAPHEAPALLAEGRAALDRLDGQLGLDRARGAACFFDRRHGAAAASVRWSPPGGVPRRIGVCQADAVRIADEQRSGSAAAGAPGGPGPGQDRPAVLGSWSRSGSQRLRLARGTERGPFILAVESGSDRPVELRRVRRGTRTTRLLRRTGPVSDRLPLPRQDHAGADPWQLDVRATGPWQVALLTADAARELNGAAEGEGTEILITAPGTRDLEFSHEGPGRYAVRRLFRDFRRGPVLIDGGGAVWGRRFQASARWLLLVEAEGPWSLSG
ncbi:hypothetical protein [Streptomyces boncukensis]|uniref:Uncharacterized protein n=1 Tax=Streptomyces boncukensis TaxID=2711219 RepID=A0A6G4X178_9ACTN|nr:hypothetical protein [Streptomyces boncukensis]NGO70421.1 hypothetical protein [Streptomyces boncukensis]